MNEVMKPDVSPLGKYAGLLLFISGALWTSGQGILISSTTRNGSFENGVLAPWGSGHDVQVLHDAAFASEGAYYASFQSPSVLPVGMGQNLSPAQDAGLLFVLSFDARAGAPSLNEVATSMGGRTPEGTSLSATVIPIAAPLLSASAWQRYEYQLLMPGAWDAAGVTFGISFSNDQTLGGVTHTAYLDNIVLIQVPEPSVFALFGLGAFLFATGLRRSRRVSAHHLVEIFKLPPPKQASMSHPARHA
jgi:hypothetical protein